MLLNCTRRSKSHTVRYLKCFPPLYHFRVPLTLRGAVWVYGKYLDIEVHARHDVLAYANSLTHHVWHPILFVPQLFLDESTREFGIRMLAVHTAAHFVLESEHIDIPLVVVFIIELLL